MKLRQLLLIAFVILHSVAAQNDFDNLEDFSKKLQEAAMEVIQQQRGDIFQALGGPPEFEAKDNFMRSFVPNTGVGNREDLSIDRIYSIPMFDDSSFTSWRYKRYNNSDFIAGIDEKNVVIQKVEKGIEDFFVFSVEQPVLHYTADYNSIVKDVVMFTRYTRRAEVLYIAILTESAKGGQITIHEIVANKAVLASLIDLGVQPSPRIYDAKKIAFVESQHGGSLVVLIASADAYKINYQRKGSNELSHYVEVYYPSAVDMITFTIHGHGYIAVANALSCEIFKMDEFVRGHLVFDGIKSYDAIVDLEYFRLGFLHYLAVTELNRQSLYVWRNGGFFLKQELLQSTGVLQLYSTVLPSCRDDVILIMVKFEGVDVYVWNGKMETFKIVGNVPAELTVQPGSITSFSHGSRAFLLLLDSQQASRVFAIESSLIPVPDPVIVASIEVSDDMKRLQATVIEQNKQMKQIQEILDLAVRTSGDQHITVQQTFKNLKSTQGATVEAIPPNVHVLWEGSKLTLEEYNAGTAKLEQDIASLEKMVQEIEAVIPDIVRLDQDAVIHGSKRFTGDITGNSVTAVSLNLLSSAGINIAKLQKELYRLDRPRQIKGTLHFEKPLTVVENLDVEKTINGIDLRDVITTDTDQVSYADMIFVNDLTVQGDININGTINGINMKSEVVTLFGDHHITGNKSFQNGILVDNIDTQLLDGVDIQNLYNTALTKSGDQNITGTVNFNGGLLTNNIILDGTLNGYNINELANNIVRIDTPAVISGHKTFIGDVTAHGPLTVDGKVNGLRIPSDLFLVDVPQVVTGVKNFTGHVSATNVTVHGKLDGLSLPEDVVTLSGNDTVTSTVYFTDGISVEGDIVVDGLVDGVDIHQLARDALKLNETRDILNAEFLGPVIIAEDLVVGGMVNGIALEDIVNDIVYKGEGPIVINAQKKFKKVVAGSVTVKKMVNGYDMTSDFMTVKGNQTIQGTKIFKKPVTFHTVFTENNMIDGLNIAELYKNRISLSIEESIPTDLEFLDHVIIEGDLKVHGTINGLRVPEDVVLKSNPGDQPISNKIFTSPVVFDDLLVTGDIEVSGTFGGVDLRKFEKDRVTLSGDQVLEGDLWLGDVTVDRVEIGGLVNGTNLTEFARNVMSLTKDQVVTAPKEFSGTVTVQGQVITTNGINGINLTELNKRAFKIYDTNYVTEPFDFTETITVTNLTVQSNINGINITELDRDSLKNKGLQYVTGTNTFEKGFHVEGDIVADTVNGIVLNRDVLLKNADQTITGTYTIEHLSIEGDLEITGLINGLDLSEMSPILARTDEETIIESDVTFQAPLHVLGNVEVTGLVNGVNLVDLEKNTLHKSGSQVVDGHKVLKGNVTVLGDFEVEEVNGENWKRFLEDVVMIDTPQIFSPKVFESDVEVQGDVFVTGSAEIGLINNFDLNTFVKEAVFIDKPANITGTKIFDSPIEITGNLDAELINGLRLKTDVVTLTCKEDSPQIITGKKTFSNLTVFGDVYVMNTVNGYNLQELYKDTLFIEGNQNVTGQKNITGLVTFMRNVYPEKVNGYDLNKELVTLAGNQDIYGPLTFKDDLILEYNLQIAGLLNGIDLQKLAQDALYLDTEQIIEGRYNIDNAVAFSDVIVNGNVNGIDLKAFDKNVTLFRQDTLHGIRQVNSLLNDQCLLAKYLHSVLEKSYYILDGYVPHQDMGLPANYIQLSPNNEELSLVQFDGIAVPIADVLQYRWDQNLNKYVFSGNYSRPIKKILSYFVNGVALDIHIGVKAKDSFLTVGGFFIESFPRGFKHATGMTRQNHAVVALLYPTRGTCDIYKVAGFETIPASPTLESYGTVIAGKEATSVAIFEISRVLYLAFSCRHEPPYSKGSSTLYAYDRKTWKIVQNIPAPASSFVAHFLYHGYHYLAFTNAVPIYETKEPKAIQIFRNTGPKELLFNLFQKIHFDDAKGLDLFEFGGLPELHLTAWNSTLVQVFRFEGESGFRTNFTIHGKCITHVKPFVLHQKPYLAVAQRNIRTSEVVTSVVYKGITQGSLLEPREFKECSKK